ncbi:hypothetical protein BURPS406E_P0293 [Burkholderia pseudomallei 406e]|nr:hypothetical protein BURPS406E_P0293 [Burkholderia pseudomallei 406e]EDU10433.1 hypothetical protein BURPS1655_C0544 [Burkholderia pseudomallei 1655]
MREPAHRRRAVRPRAASRRAVPCRSVCRVPCTVPPPGRRRHGGQCALQPL